MEKCINSEKLPDGVVERFSQGPVGATVLGKPFNARLLFSTPEKSEELYPDTTALRQALLTQLAAETKKYDITSIAVPRVDRFNAGLTSSDLLPRAEAETLENNTLLIRGDNEAFFYDGVILQPHEAALIITGDCHTIVAWSEDPSEPVIAAHAGRNSLHTVLDNTHKDDVDSVVDAIAARYQDKTKVHVRIMAGIGPEQFTHPLDHPDYALNNEKLVAFFEQCGAANTLDPEGKIDIAEAIKTQFDIAGVPLEHISHDGLDAATDKRLWSNRIDGKPRNAVLVMHKG